MAPTIFSGVQPTGRLTLGNLLGAVRRWAEEDQHRTDRALFCLVDLHALTVEHDAARLAARTREAAALLLACGIDPDRALLFAQSHVPSHTRLHWLMECTVSDGELNRMIQYREKRRAQQSVRAALLTYPALMAADILAYGTDEVPVGEDQAQHGELARDLAVRFNHRYGQGQEVFTVPRVTLPPVGARVMDLADPTVKMSKSAPTPAGVVHILDDPDEIRRKIMRAVTDGGSEVAYDRENKPGVTNLLDILAACTGADPRALAAGYDGYGALKKDTAEAVLSLLRPIQRRYAELSADPGGLAAVLREGAQRAEALAAPRVDAAYRAIGLLPPA